MLSKRFLLPKSPMRQKRPTITITQIRWYDQFFSIEMSGNKKRLPGCLNLMGFGYRLYPSYGLAITLATNATVTINPPTKNKP